MSEYQYYEFCRINNPLTQEARKEMASLSSRAKITTHGASYVYNYGDFRGDAKKLLLKYFDVFFYISNWGTIRLMFKYPKERIDVNEIKKFCIKNVINCEQHGQNILLNLCVSNEEYGGWTEGEGLLPDLLPLYEEIAAKNYFILQLISSINNKLTKKNKNSLNFSASDIKLSLAQRTFLDSIGI